MDAFERYKAWLEGVRYLVYSVKKTTQVDLAAKTGIEKQSLNAVLKGRQGKRASPFLQDAISKALGLSYDHMLYLGQWILEGKDPDQLYDKIKLIEKSGENPVHKSIRVESFPFKKVDPISAVKITPSNEEESLFCLVPKYKARLSAGHGSFEDGDQVEANLAFRKDWISRKSTDGLALFEVIGDSMAPFIQEGDVVMVDLADNDPQMIIDGKTYAIREENTVKVKRLIRQGGQLLIRSQDSTLYPDYEADQNTHLIGRVIWVGHEVK
jgi:SOS-response transcriptional repressor LexA